MENGRRDSVLALWRWPLVVIIVSIGVLFFANRFLNTATKSLMPSYNTTTLIQTSVSRLQKEAKLVVLSADVTVEVTRTSSKILWERLDFGDTIVTVRAKGNRAQYFVSLEQIKDNDFRISNGGKNLLVTVPEPRVDESIVEVQSDPNQMEVKTDIGWGRLDKRSGEMARVEAKRGLRDAVIAEAKSPIYMDLARKNAQEKVTALLKPLVQQMGVTNLAVEFRRP